MKAARKDAPFSLRNGKLQSTGREESGHESERSHDPAASASLVSKLGDIRQAFAGRQSCQALVGILSIGNVAKPQSWDIGVALSRLSRSREENSQIG
jgi:hypothetical protein